MITHTGIDYFMSIPITEVMEIIDEVNDIGRQKRIYPKNKNRRKR